MCQKTNFKRCPSEIDKCMENAIHILNNRFHINIIACCCGHGKYPMTIVIEDDLGIYELFSGEDIPRKRKFYKRDKKGYYYIPETIQNGQKRI